ncbi:MAG: hypothetical protein HYU66_11940 [Armatimonadetes bacterium]|nr:hypothetical protein [Armatimonadota bacterium]
MVIFSTLGGLLLLLKDTCFTLVTFLTVMVALTNEAHRMHLTLPWLEQRYAQVRQAWAASLSVFGVLAVLYALVEHNIVALVIDALKLLLMLGLVYFLANRGKKTRRRLDAMDDAEPEEELPPRRPLDGNRYRRVPRRRRDG